MQDNSRKFFWAANNTLLAKQLSSIDADPLFALIDSNREHLSQFGDTTSARYPTPESVLSSILNPPNPLCSRFGVWRGDTLLGAINSMPEQNIPKTSTIGFWVASQFKGQQVAEGALKGLLEWGSKNDVRFVFADVHYLNFKSQAVLKRVGLKHINTKDNIEIWSTFLRKPPTR